MWTTAKTGRWPSTASISAATIDFGIALDQVSDRLAPHYRDCGFVEHGESLVRFCIPAVLRRNEVLDRMESLRPGSSSAFSAMEPGELERQCSPLCLADFEQSFLIIPIRPGYAMNIVDFMGAANDLYGVSGQRRPLF